MEDTIPGSVHDEGGIRRVHTSQVLVCDELCQLHHRGTWPVVRERVHVAVSGTISVTLPPVLGWVFRALFRGVSRALFSIMFADTGSSFASGQ